MKVGILRCQQTEDMCSATACLKAAREGKLAFEETGPVDVVGIVTCGGCPGKRAAARVKMMADRGAEAIVMASCVSKGLPYDEPCAFYEQMKALSRKQVGPDMRFIEWSH